MNYPTYRQAAAEIGQILFLDEQYAVQVAALLMDFGVLPAGHARRPVPIDADGLRRLTFGLAAAAVSYSRKQIVYAANAGVCDQLFELGQQQLNVWINHVGVGVSIELPGSVTGLLVDLIRRSTHPSEA